MMRCRPAFVLLVAIAAACGDDEQSSAPDGGVAGAAGMMSAPSDYDALSTCEAAMPCRSVLAQFAEATPYIDREGLTCIFEALAARTPGLYLYENNSTNTATSTGTDFALLVREDGSVSYAAQGTFSSAVEPETKVTPRPSARCVLKPASYFESCIDALDSFDPTTPSNPAWQCAYGDLRTLWLTQCADTPIRACE